MRYSSFIAGKRLAQDHPADELLTAAFLRCARYSEMEVGLKSAFPMFEKELKCRRLSKRGLLNKDFFVGSQILFIPEGEWDLLGKPNHLSVHRRYGFIVDQDSDKEFSEHIQCAFWSSDDSGALIIPTSSKSLEFMTVDVNLLLTERSVSDDSVSNTLHHIRAMRRMSK